MVSRFFSKCADSQRQRLSGVATVFVLVACAFSSPAFAIQVCSTGDDGTPVINNQTMVNTYWAAPASVTTTLPAASTSIPIDTVLGPVGGGPVQAGDNLIVIQMQGVEIDPNGNTQIAPADYGDGPGRNDRSGHLNNGNFIVGNYEFVVATGPVSGGAIPITGEGAGNGLLNNYVSSDVVAGGLGYRRYQVVRVPQYVNLTLDPGAVVISERWTGRVGGITGVNVRETLTFNGGGFEANGRGFRGGQFVPGLVTTDSNGYKGEGIAGSPERLYSNLAPGNGEETGPNGYPGGSTGLGAPGNAGSGGGGSEDSGGGGGANGGFGGNGGRGVTAATGGIGGAPFPDWFPATPSRLVMGGGGGASNGDDSPVILSVSSGQAGAGIIFIRSRNIVVNSGFIRANGDAAGTASTEGGGGGGAGGSILIHSDQADITGLTIQALGGKGGDSLNNLDGGGGGGSGGQVIISETIGATPIVTGGAAGTGNSGGVYNGTAGQNGVVLNNIPAIALFDCEFASIGAAKDMSFAGTGPWTVTIDYYLENFGNAAISSLSMADDLEAVFGVAGVDWTLVSASYLSGPGTLNVNPGFNGETAGDTELLNGGSLDEAGSGNELAQIRVVLNLISSGAYSNQVLVEGESPANPNPGTPNVSDLSTSGTDPDGTTLDDDPSENDVSLLDINAAPTANDDSASTATNTSVAVDVLANDTDPDADPLTITASDSPTANGGSTVINNNGTPGNPADDFIDYTPAAAFQGFDTFTYTIDDGQGGTDTATVTVLVGNGPPVANDDTASTTTNTLVSVDVLANDSDPNGDVLTITASDSPSANGGSTVINNNGTPADPSDDFIDYTSAATFKGSDTFTYTISDGNGGTDTATVTVTVNNAPPVANDDAVSTNTDTAVAVNVLANDTDANGDTLTITAVTSPTANGGTAVLNNNGTPADPTDDFIDYTPPAGFAGSDTFTYTIDDGDGGTDSATVTVTVNNAAPVANDDAVSTNTDTAVAVNVLANDTDANGDTLTITAVTSPTANGGTAVLNNNGTPADPTDDFIDYTPPSGFAGSDTFTYTIDDGNGGTDTATVTVTVNNAAPVANDDAASTATNTLVSVDVLANDTDANGDTLTITAVASPTANGGTAVLNNNGTPADPTDDFIDYTPPSGFAGSDTFTYTIDDGNGGTDTATVTVTVNNAAPVANDDAASTATNTLVSVDVLANDTDANGDPLTITAVASPTANGGTAVLNNNGTPADPTDDFIDYTPPSGFAGSDTFTYTIDDGNGGTDTATVTVTVNNAAPVANDDAASTATNTLVSVDVLANDTDANGDPLTITAVASPTANGGTAVLNNNGTPADPTDDFIDYTPPSGFAGSDTFTYTIDDGNGGTDSATVTVTVNNAAPVANDDAVSTNTDTAVAVNVLANDTDANGDTLTITAVTSPTANGGTAVLNNNGTPADPTDDFIDYTPPCGLCRQRHLYLHH